MKEKRFIRAGWLIDGSGDGVRRDVLLTVGDATIAAIDKFSPAMIDDPGRLVDLSFATLLPPLIDCHLHLTMSGSMDPGVREQQLVAGCGELELVIERHLQLLAAHGVLAVRDGGDRDGCVLEYLGRQASSKWPVRIVTPGRAWHRQGRYGGLIGRAPAADVHLAEAFAAEKAQTTWIKLVNSGLNSLKLFGRETPPQFTAAEISRLVEAAALQGQRVMVHANGRQAVREAVEGGCHSVEHGFFMGRDNLALMAERGCVWVPTACTMKAYAEVLEYERNFTGSAVARKNLDHQLEQLRLARELGVTVALGTDAGSPGVLHGESVIEEMKLLARAGYSLAEIVRAATLAGAGLLGLDDTGLIAPGRPADFLVVRGAPTQLPRKLSYLEGIYLGGEPCDFYRKNPVKHLHRPG